MLSQPTLARVIDLFRAVADSEGYAEIIRQVLCEIPKFEPYSAFKHLSKSSQSITRQTLLEFLQAGEPDINEQDVSYLIERFDSNEDEKVSYADFLTIVLPKDNQDLRKETHNRKSSPLDNGQAFDRKVQHALVKVFKEELRNFKVCEEIRRELRQASDFTVMDTFNKIDVEGEGHLNLVKFMEENNQTFADAEGKAFMLRVDKKGAGIIGYSDFLEIFYQKESTYIQPKRTPSPLSPQLLVQGNNYIVKLRDNYSSPRLRYHSPTKVQHSGEVFNSPQSTKASYYNGSEQKTPKKEVQQEPVEEEPVFLSSPELQITFAPLHESISFAPESERKLDSPIMPRQGAELAEALKEVVKHNKYLETLKNGLALLKDFNVFNAFAIFDGDRKGVLNRQKLEQGLKSLDISIIKTDVTLLTSRFALNADGLIKYEDFLRVLMPRYPEFARLLNGRDPYFVSDIETVTEAFSDKALSSFKAFLKGLVEGEVLFEAVKQRLADSKEFNLRDAFRALSQDNSDTVTVDHFKALLEENGHFASQKDVQGLVDRFTKDSKAEITYINFIREMAPRLTQKH